MSIITFLIGTAIPAATGWCLLRLIEGSRPVLSHTERIAAGAALGITLSMWLVFVLHVATGMALSRMGFLGAELAALALAGGAVWWLRPTGSAAPAPSAPRARWEILVWILLTFSILKVAAAAITFLLLTPTYLDDALDNWNLRGKVFFEDQTLTLTMPGEDPILSPKGVSSYPPAVPLFKTSLAAIAGTWQDPLVNAPHVLWFALIAILLWSAVRKRLTRPWALIAVYGYLSMPLATMHGTNPYADVFVSLHVFLAAAWTLDLLLERDPARLPVRFLLLGIAFAALSFTKNEGIIVYMPPLVLILLIRCGMWLHSRAHPPRVLLRFLLSTALPLLLVLVPWLLFKWTHGLTFGNAKPFTSFVIYWRENVLMSVAVNTFFEGNWLLLFPLFFGLLAWRWQRAWTTYLPLTAFVTIVYLGQMMLFLFTDLAAEALMQTGYARGLIQLLPCIILLTTVLLADAAGEEPRV